MWAVVDTNVLVSASINREGRPGQLLARIRSLELVPVVSPVILDEYADVLRRGRFGFPREWVDVLLADMTGLATHVLPAMVSVVGLPDPDDAPFIAAALAAQCPIVTSNGRHFPADCGVEILSPAECLVRLTG